MYFICIYAQRFENGPNIPKSKLFKISLYCLFFHIKGVIHGDVQRMKSKLKCKHNTNYLKDWSLDDWKLIYIRLSKQAI